MRAFVFGALLVAMLGAPAYAQTVTDLAVQNAQETDLRIVGDASLQGLSGKAKPGRKPLFSQKVVFNRVVQVMEPFDIKWTFADKEKYAAGEYLYGRGEYWCGPHNVCMLDADKDGKLDSGFQQYQLAGQRLLLASRVGRKLEPPNVMAAYQLAEPPAEFEHAIGIGVSDIKFDKKANETLATFFVAVRRSNSTSDQWQEILLAGGRAPVTADGTAQFEVFGSVVEIVVTDAKKKTFDWTVVQPLRAQAFPALMMF